MNPEISVLYLLLVVLGDCATLKVRHLIVCDVHLILNTLVHDAEWIDGRRQGDLFLTNSL